MRRRGLAYRLGLARERGVVGAQLELLDEPRICRDRVAFFKDHQIAGDQLGRGDLNRLAVSDHLGVVRDHLFEGLGGLLGAELLPEREDRVDEDDREDRPAELRHAADEGEDATDPQHDGEQVIEVLEELQDQRAALDLADLVAPVLLETLCGIFGGQPLGARAERLEELTAGLGPACFVHAARVLLRHRVSSPRNRKKTRPPNADAP